MSKIFLLILLLPVVLALSACSSGSGEALTANLWMLSELNNQAPLPDAAITAEFGEDGKVSGSSGCNNYNTTYEVSGNKITFGEQSAMTMMACPDPVMEQERVYLETLTAAATFEIVDDELTLFDAEGNALAKFEAISQSLEGSSWEVIGYNNGKGGVVSVIIGTEIMADFGEDGQLTGNASCNNYFASYETEGDNITIGPAGSTMMACPEPEGIMEQEQQYLASLETAATYKITGLDMEMRTSEGSLVATFKRAVMP
jgi:heat shock protein HslJ